MRFFPLIPVVALLSGCAILTEPPTIIDEDGDGYYTASCTQFAGMDTKLCRSEDEVDCDDSRPDIHPDADEICDGVDNNCDDRVDEGCDTGDTGT